MKFRTAVFVLAAAAMVCALAAQENAAQGNGAKHHHYMFVDLGTLGGPHSYGSVNGDGFSLLNNSGVVASLADLDLPDPNQEYGCYDSDCYQAHAFQWKNGVMTDFGALPVNNNSAAGSINSWGSMTGQSQSDQIDPIVGIPEYRAVLWKNGQIVDLGTLGAGTESLGIYINDAGQVIGFSTIDTTSDPIGFFGFPTHTFIWQNGQKLDIGTLGGADAFPGASCTNPPTGIVVGGSTTSTISNPDTGLPTFAPYLWLNGKMTELGTLGGTFGIAQCANHRGQVIGMSSLSENPGACIPAIVFGGAANPGCHAFFWQNGVMSDLGTLGGDISEAIWFNDAADVVGSADLPGGLTHDAVLWRHGKIHDLGIVPGDSCSRGRGLNARGQAVGGSSDCHNFLHAFLWENGGPMVDLNTVIQPGTGYQLTNAFNINDRGEILAKAAPLGFTPNDDADLGHLALLIPCDDGHPNVEGCDYSMVDAASAQTSVSTARPMAVGQQTASSPAQTVNSFRNRYMQRYRLNGQRPVAHD